MKYIFSFLLIFITGFVQAQTIIKGTVLGESGKPETNINVAVGEKGSNLMSAYSMTDNRGQYKLEYKGKSDSLAVWISGFNIKKETKIVANRNQEVNFYIEMETIVLNEVKIKPPKIRQTGDTLSYSVDSFKDENDRTIGDVLKKLPGIEVKDNGAIHYQDKPINKFYIEDADLLQGRYGIATNNIEAKDVSTVQVMENHQPVKALKDKVFSEEAAINLKLKDSAKGTLIATTQLGMGGFPILWNNELMGMYITKSLQNITTYKGNNSGDDVTREQFSFYVNDASRMGSSSLLNVQSPSAPSIREKRYLDNQQNTVSVNNLKKLGKDYNLTANINYLNDLQHKSSYSLSEYYLSAGDAMTIEEILDWRLRKEKLDAEILLNANTPKYYFDNKLKIGGVWDRERGDIASVDNIYQSLHKPDYSINNTFKMVKTNGGHTWDFYSFNGYTTSSQTLSVQPVLYDQLFDPAPAANAMVQDVERGNFNSNNKISFSLGGKNPFKQNYSLGFLADLQNMSSKLFADTHNQQQIPDSLRNDLRQNKLAWTFTPNYTYSKGMKLNMSLSLPVSYTLINRNNKIERLKKDNTYLFFNPSFFTNYKISAYWSTAFNYGYNNQIGSITDVYTGYIMSSYRNLFNNDGRVFKQKSQNASLMLSYRNPITTLFAMANVSYFHYKSNVLHDYFYEGILRKRTTLDIPNTTEGVSAWVSANKEVEALSTTFFLSGSYTESSSAQMNQGNLLDYKNRNYSFAPRILTKLGSFASVEYQFRYSQSKNEVKQDGYEYEPIRTTSQNAQLNLFPMKGFVINLKYESFYNNAITSDSRSMSFGDISVKYKWKKAELILDYTNVFNTKRFISASYSDVSKFYSSYALRPAEIMLKARFKLK